MRALLAATLFVLCWGSALPEQKLNVLVGDNTETDASRGPPPLIEIESASYRAGRLAVAEMTPNFAPEEMPHLDTVELQIEPINPDITSKQASLNELCNALFTSAEDNGLPVQFFANLIWQESGLRNDTVSRVGALGIAQFMPETAKENGLNDPFDPHQAIPASAKLLQQLRDQFGNLGFAAAAYNAGPHRVSNWLASGHALPRETLDYVVRVTGRSADQWRTAPPPETALAFRQELPCRALPAFASLEQTQAQQAEIELLPQTTAASGEDKKAKVTRPLQTKPEAASEHHDTRSKVSLARAWAKALNVASRDEPGRHRLKRERQAMHQKARSERGRKLADARES